MRRNYISPEHEYTEVSGTFNMIENKSYMGSKMMKIEDDIIIDSRDIIYYQQTNGEQLDIIQELTFPPVIYSMINDKLDNYAIEMSPTQSDFNRQKRTIWHIDINLENLLINYLYANIKASRTFENITSINTSVNDVNKAIRLYIRENLLSRYRFYSFDLYISYNSLEDDGNLRYQNTWTPSIIQDNTTLLKKVELDINSDSTKLRSTFTQEKDSDKFNFNYYFNIKFERI